MKKIVKLSVATDMLMGMSAVSAQADDGVNVLSDIYVKGEIRPRYEMVDTNNATANANAVTNRLVIGVGGKLGGSDIFSAYAEMTDVHSLNDGNYNALDNSKGADAADNNIVADSEQTRLTQAYIDIKPMDGLLIRYGRQMINLGDQRFVGAVGWRQMPQTYDATLLSFSPTKEINLSTVYATKVNTIFQDFDHPTDPAKDKVSGFQTATSLTNLSYRTKGLDITAYAYLISSISDTYGAYVKGSVPVSDGIKVSYRAEYAVQTDASLETENQGKPDCDSDYIHANLGVNMSGILFGVDYMMQSADDDNTVAGAGTTNKAFKTPLGTNHKFNGWADQFLATPENGLEDISAMAGYKAKDFGTFKVIYHKFASDDKSIDYGSEVDAVYVNKIPGVKGLKGMLKYADYNGDDSTASGNPKATDTQKFWVMLDYKFASK